MSLLERGLFPTGPTPSSFDHNELMPFHQADQDLKRKDKSIFTSNQSGASPAATFYSGWPEWEAPYPSPPPLCSPVDLVATGAARCCSRSMVGSAERAKWKCKSRWRQPEPAVPRFPLCRGRPDWLCGKCCLQLARKFTAALTVLQRAIPRRLEVTPNLKGRGKFLWNQKNMTKFTWKLEERAETESDIDDHC